MDARWILIWKTGDRRDVPSEKSFQIPRPVNHTQNNEL
jgi:hypothetical protein